MLEYPPQSRDDLNYLQRFREDLTFNQPVTREKTVTKSVTIDLDYDRPRLRSTKSVTIDLDCLQRVNMELKMPVVLAIVGVVCAVLALIFQIVGVATAAWVTSDSTDAGSGLWKSCVGGTCFDLSDFLELRGEELPGKLLAVF